MPELRKLKGRMMEKGITGIQIAAMIGREKKLCLCYLQWQGQPKTGSGLHHLPCAGHRACRNAQILFRGGYRVMFEIIMLGLMLFGGMAVLSLLYIVAEEIQRQRYWKRKKRAVKQAVRCAKIETERQAD